MLPTRHPPQNKRPTQTESEGLKTNIPSKWTGKKTWWSNTNIRQIRLQKEDHKKRARRSLHNTQRKNPSRRHKHYKYICIQYKSTQIHKENLGGLLGTALPGFRGCNPPWLRLSQSWDHKPLRPIFLTEVPPLPTSPCLALRLTG